MPSNLTVKQCLCVATNLQSIREKMGLSIDGLARSAGIHRNTIFRWENKMATPEVTPLVKLINALVANGLKLPDFDDTYEVEKLLSILPRLSTSRSTLTRLKLTRGIVENWRYKKGRAVPPLRVLAKLDKGLIANGGEEDFVVGKEHVKNGS